MSSQAFFWVNVGLGLFLILIFLIGKRGIVAPTKLNLKKGLTGRGVTVRGAQYHSPEALDPEFAENEKSLNVLFVYNGHTFDAYEVLGAPAGASFEMVQRYYQTALQKSGHERDFLKAAFGAIQSSASRRQT